MSPGSLNMLCFGWEGWQERWIRGLHFSGLGPTQIQGKEKAENFHPLLFDKSPSLKVWYTEVARISVTPPHTHWIMKISTISRLYSEHLIFNHPDSTISIDYTRFVSISACCFTHPSSHLFLSTFWILSFTRSHFFSCFFL